jgi:hypothetical protein
VDRRRLKNPARRAKLPAAAIFSKTLFAKASACAWTEQRRGFFILEMSCPVVFSGASLETAWEPLENAYAQEGNRPVAVWDRPPRGVIAGGSHSELSDCYS